MASLRDVFQHAGRNVRLQADGVTRAEGKAMLRETTILLEVRLDPKVGEIVTFVDPPMSFRIVRVEPQFFQDKIDHYRAEAAPVRG